LSGISRLVARARSCSAMFIEIFKTVLAYHGRPHRGLRMRPPIGARWLPPVRRVPPKDVVTRPVLGGLHHEYHARVA
jgi:hypothetical protein